jgi:N-carbamoylputrescine amidase
MKTKRILLFFSAFGIMFFGCAEQKKKQTDSPQTDKKEMSRKDFYTPIADTLIAREAGQGKTAEDFMYDPYTHYTKAVKQNENGVLIAICQIFCLDDDREGNFVRIENALREAKAKGAEIACLPETAIYGWINPSAFDRAFSIPGEDSERLAELARKYGLFICIGLAEREELDYYDAVILLDDEGKLLMKHRKVNTLEGLCDPAYKPGNSFGAVDTKFGRIGMVICADSFRPENGEAMKNEKPDFVLIPYGWAADEGRWPEHGPDLVRTVGNFARWSGCPVVGTDLIGQISKGPWRGKYYGGWSNACDKTGKPLVICADRDRDVRIVEIVPGR